MAQTSVQSKSQELKNTLDSLIDNYRENPEQIAELLAFKSRFYRYSMNNTALILNQNPYATFVASYDDWKEKGYQVQRGQQGIKIIFPIRTEIFEIGEKDGKKQYRRVTNATAEEKKMIANGQIKPFTTTRFGVGNVFDISQTNCPTEEYPKFFHMGYRSEQHSILYDSVKQYAIQKGISVEEVDLQSISLRGEFSPLTNSIRISDKLNDTEKLSTLTHELGHALLHRDPASLDKNSSMKELEADCISIMLQQQFGIELTESRKQHLAQHYRICQGLEDFSLEDMLKNVNQEYSDLREELDLILDTIIENETKPINIQQQYQIISNWLDKYYPNQKDYVEKYLYLDAELPILEYYKNFESDDIFNPNNIDEKAINIKSALQIGVDISPLLKENYTALQMSIILEVLQNNEHIPDCLRFTATNESDITILREYLREDVIISQKVENDLHQYPVNVQDDPQLQNYLFEKHMSLLEIDKGHTLLSYEKTPPADEYEAAMIQEFPPDYHQIRLELDNKITLLNQINNNLKKYNKPVGTSVLLVSKESNSPQKSHLAPIRNTVVINAFGGPGAGKTTACYDILSELKKRGFAADYAPEYATELVWDNKLALLDGSDENQPKLLAEQKHRIDRLIDKVDFVVTDSPLLLNAIYYKGQNPDYEKMVQETYSEYNNFNFVIQRDENQFTQKGRIHNLEESKEKDKEIFDMLSRNGLSYGTYTHESVGKVVEDAIAMYQSLNVPVVPTQELKKNLDIAEREQKSKTAHSVDYKEQDTAAVLDYIKRGVSILQVAEDMGFTPQQIGGYYTLKEHDSVRFYMDTNSFHRFSADVGGSTIDFVKHFGGMNDKEAILTLKEKYVGNRLDSLPQYAPELTAAPEPKKFVLPDKIEGKYARVFAYLTKTRCIDADIVQGLMTDGLIYEDNNHNVVFVGKDASGQPAFATRHTTLTQSNYKRDVAGSRQDVGFHIDHSATRLYVTEAPIDALSIMCLRKQQGHDIKDANYLATCGTGKDAALYYWLKSHPQIKEVILANDNDEAGQKASRKIFQTLKKDFPEIKISTLKIQGKDANEHLCIKSCPKNPKKKIQQEVER